MRGKTRKISKNEDEFPKVEVRAEEKATQFATTTPILLRRFATRVRRHAIGRGRIFSILTACVFLPAFAVEERIRLAASAPLRSLSAHMVGASPIYLLHATPLLIFPSAPPYLCCNTLYNGLSEKSTKYSVDEIGKQKLHILPLRSTASAASCGTMLCPFPRVSGVDVRQNR